jgi:protein TonB
MAHPRLEASSLRPQYGTHLQVGLALSLAVLLAVAHFSPSLDKETNPTIQTQETADLRHVQSTGQAQAPPVPPTPMLPQVVPGEEIAESPSVEFDPSLGLDATGNQSDEVAKRPDCGGPQSLRKKTYYPPSALSESVEGRVLVEFVVDEDGNIESPEVADGAGELLNQAALRAVRRLKCTPARQRARPVKAKMTKLVVFALPKELSP